MTDGRDIAVQRPSEIADRCIQARYDPIGRPLEYSKTLRDFCYLWSDLSSGCAVAYQSNSLVLEIVGPIPPCGMHLLAGE